jgi:hypothetical protein
MSTAADNTAALEFAATEIDQLLAAKGRSGSAAAVVYLSLQAPQSFVAARDPDGKLTPLIGFMALPLRGEDLLAAIAGIDENGPRLLVNYERMFPELMATIREFCTELEPAESDSLRWLLAAASVVIGLQEEDLRLALEPAGQLVQLDAVVVEQGDGYVFDSRRLLRSMMSYRIAGVESHQLVRSLFDSLGNYAGTAVRRLLRDWKVDTMVAAGDVFASNPFVAERTRRGLIRPGLELVFPDIPSEPS